MKQAELLPTPLSPALLKKHKLSDSEYSLVLKILGRSPTMTELGIFSAMWSEHCSYKSSKLHLKRFWTDNENVVVGPGENAGVVRIKGKLCAVFKMESHNHPSYIEPYQGAATGVGGILRDVFCMGARPIANLNCLRFGLRSHPRTSLVLSEGVRGIGDYGNCIGVPTVGGSIRFDASYNGNCLVNAMTVGLIHEDEIFKGYASGVGNLVVYVGSSTGRDGVHGATMASDSFSSDSSSEERSAVQVGDPFTEKLLLEATLESLEKNLIVGLQDMGAAGLTSSSFEMAARAGNGLEIDLDQVPVRTKNLSAYELMLSESQERMLMVIEPQKWEDLEKVFKKWNLSYAVIGKVTDSDRVRIYYKGLMEVDMPVAEATDSAPLYNRPQKAKLAPHSPDFFSSPKGLQLSEKLTVAIRRSIENLSPTSKLFQFLRVSILDQVAEIDFVTRQYDRHIGNRTVLSSHDRGAAVVWIHDAEAFGGNTKSTNATNETSEFLGISVAAGCLEDFVELDPFKGSEICVLKLYKSLTAVGSTPLAMTDCLNFGSPESPAVMWSFAQSVDGITQASRELNVPIVSGNVSLYNDTDGTPIKPTPMLGIVGRVDDVRYVRSAILKKSEHKETYLLWLKPLDSTCSNRSALNLGATFISKFLSEQPELAADLDQSSLSVSPVSWQEEKKMAEFLSHPSLVDKILSAREVARGGVLAGAVKMYLGSDQGLDITLGKDMLGPELFFEVTNGYLLQCSDVLSLKDRAAKMNLNLIEIGRVNGATTAFTFNGTELITSNSQFIKS